MGMIDRAVRRSRAVRFAVAALGATLAAGIAAAASPDAAAPSPHAVKTNIPGIYAYTQPPAGFNPTTATNAELKAWGYPPRPSPRDGAEALARWKDMVNPAMRRIVPDFAPRKGIYHRPAMRLRVAATPRNTNGPILASSSNWSGVALVPAAGGQPFSSVVGRWTVPTVQQAPSRCSGGWDYSSQWVGIGGFGDTDLLQAGSAADVFCDIGQDIPEYFPWIEWLPNYELVLYKNAATLTLLPFQPGDYLIVTVTATGFSGGVSTTGTLHFVDVTQHWSASLEFTAAALGGSQVTGQSAEWIVERTQVNGGLATLPNYTADPWWFARATDLGNVTHNSNGPGTATAYNITMVDDSNANVSFVNQFGVNSLWFFPEGSATQ